MNPIVAQRDWVAEPLQVLSYGGGTQSTAMLLLIAQGHLPKPDIVIHADTGSELPETVDFIDVAKRFTQEKLGIPFAVVSSFRGSLHDDYMSHSRIPMIGWRSCTSNFKILPQRRFIRTIVGNGGGQLLAECWLGITTDESGRRAEQTDVKWTGLRYPLLDDFPFTRDQCIELNISFGWEVSKSGCFCCPYQGGKTWLELKRTHPELFMIAVQMEEMKFERWGGKVGLYQHRKLRDIDTLELEHATCDTGAGCFL